MAAWMILGVRFGAKALVLGGGAAAALGAGALVWQGQRAPVAEIASVAVEENAEAVADTADEPVVTESPEPEAEVAAVPEPAVQPKDVPQETVTEASPETEAADADVAAVAPEAAEPAAPAPEPPAFDLVRVEPDGSALVAGRAEPSSAVSVVVDGSEVATASADGQGNFVAMFTLPESTTPRVVTLAMGLADGSIMSSDDSVVLAPTPEPEVLADIGADVAAAVVPGTDTESAEAAAPADEPAPEVVAAADADAADAQVPVNEAVVAAEPAAAADAPASELEAVAAEPVAPAALLVTDSGAKVLQTGDDAPAGFMRNVTIDAISYSASGDVQLAGRGQAGAFVRLYLDNLPVLDTRIASDGSWSGTLSTFEAGVYVLRADQVDADGKVGSRYETPFQREAPEALAAAAPASGHGATTLAPVSITVQPGFTLWGIARENYGDGVMYVRVYEANKAQIKDPDLIYPGQVFSVPSEK